MKQISVPTIILIASKLQYDEAIYAINELNKTDANKVFYFYVGTCDDSYCVLGKVIVLDDDITVDLSKFTPMNKGY